ncbi:acetylglutamate/acetylaminoadipate kinase [Halobacteriales archaeon Cl-PHB]
MTVVIKVGGARAVDPAGALSDVATLAKGEEGQEFDAASGAGPTDVVVTHGGSTAVDDTLERLGMDPEYVETPSGVVGRFTDADTMEVFEMVMPGLLNTEMVANLQSEGVDAVGLSGVDGKLLHGPRKSAVRVVEDGKKKIRRGDHSGSLKEVNADLLETLLADGYTPVVSPPMAGADDGDITPVNTDADRSAAAIAGEVDGTLILLTDVPGILEDPEDRDTLIREVETPEEWEQMEAAAEGFMGRKVMAIEEALENGASEAIVADANLENPILTALEGDGTHVYPSALEGDSGEGGGADA